MSSDAKSIKRVEEIIDLGWMPIPVAFKGKMPVLDNWESPNYKDPGEAINHWRTNKYNIGVLLGDKSLGLVDIDLDGTDAVRMAGRFLPSTLCRFGRSGNPNSHYLYMTTPPATTEKFKDPTSKDKDKSVMIAEIRANGHQTVFPPSIHESGEPIRFEKGCNLKGIQTIDAEVLRLAVAKLSSAVLIGRHWAEGGRHESSMALAGMLHRMKWAEEEIIMFMEAVCEISGDDEKADRIRTIKDTISRAERGMRTTGATKLGEYLPTEVVSRVRSFLSSADGDKVSDLNEEYAMVLLGSKATIMKRSYDPIYERDRMDFMSITDFKSWLANQFITLMDGEKMKVIPLADYWIKSKDRLSYDQVVFSPEKEIPHALNLWQGFPIEPEKGNCSLFLDHIRVNICSGNEEWYHWVMSFISDMFQHPAKRPGVALVLRGRQGTGKGVFASQLGMMVAPHFIQVSHSRHLTGNFNSHLRDVILVFADEAFYAGDKSHAGVLKSMITEPDINIELKGKDVFSILNYIRLIVASNENWVVPAGMNERRFAVFDVSTENEQNHDYFEAVINQMDNGGRSALMDVFMKWDLDGVNLRKIPDTVALAEQKVTTASPVQQWYLSRLLDGDLAPRAAGNMKDPENEPWPDWIVKEVVYRDYLASTQDAGLYRRGLEVQFWLEMKKAIGLKTEEKSKLVYMDRNVDGEIITTKERKTVIKMPSLVACRLEFCDMMKTDISWPKPMAEEKEDY